MEAVTGRLASKAELKAHVQEVEAAHKHDSRYTAKVRLLLRSVGRWCVASGCLCLVMARRAASPQANRRRHARFGTGLMGTAGCCGVAAGRRALTGHHRCATAAVAQRSGGEAARLHEEHAQHDGRRPAGTLRRAAVPPNAGLSPSVTADAGGRRGSIQVNAASKPPSAVRERS